MNKLFKWLKASNRYLHLFGGILVGVGAHDVYCVAYSGIGIAAALEVKDIQWGGKWAWSDFAITVVGTAIGQTIRLIL
jgi:hypothetical protein